MIEQGAENLPTRQAIETELQSAQLVFNVIEDTFVKINPADPAHFLRSYMRVGLLKERIAERTLPEYRELLENLKESDEEKPNEETEELSQDDKKPKLVFLAGEQLKQRGNEIELNGKRIQLGENEYKLLKYLSNHIDEEVRTGVILQEAFEGRSAQDVNLTSRAKALAKKLNLSEGPNYIETSGNKASASWIKLQGVEIPNQEKEGTDEQGDLGIGEMEPVDFDSNPPPKIEQIGFLGAGEIVEYPYEPSEDEKRSEVENRILNSIVDSLLNNRPITFENLQVALATEKTIKSLPHGLVNIYVYQADELKEIFSEGLRKIREEAEITSLRRLWNEEEEVFFNNLGESIRSLSGRDISDFQKKVKRMLDNAERGFYNSLPADQRNKKILFITVDRKELVGRQ